MARNAGEITIEGRDVMQRLTLRLRMPRAFGLRMRLAAMCAHLAGKLSGTAVEVVSRGEDDDVVEGTRFLGDLRRLVVQPGDRFVVSTDRVLSRDNQKQIYAEWKRFMGADAPRLLILDSGFRLGAISDGDGRAQARALDR